MGTPALIERHAGFGPGRRQGFSFLRRPGSAERGGPTWVRNVSAGEWHSAVPYYRYELRRGYEVIATGHLTREQPLELDDRISIGGRMGIVRGIEPVFGEHELRLVVQLTGHEFGR